MAYSTNVCMRLYWISAVYRWIVASTYARKANRERERESAYNWQITSTAAMRRVPGVRPPWSDSEFVHTSVISVCALKFHECACVYFCVCHFAGGPFTSSGKMRTHIQGVFICSTYNHCWLAQAYRQRALPQTTASHRCSRLTIVHSHQCLNDNVRARRVRVHPHAIHSDPSTRLDTRHTYTFKAPPFESIFPPLYRTLFMWHSKFRPAFIS